MPESCRRHHVLALTWSLTVPQALREIRHAGGDVNRPDADQRTALHQAAWEGGLVTVQALVEEFDANPSPRDKWRRTPLDEALFHEHTEVVDYLLSQGARGKVSAWRRLRAKLRRRRKPAVRGMVAAAGQEKMTRRGGGGSKDTSPDSSLHSGSSFTRRSRDGRNSKGGGDNSKEGTPSNSFSFAKKLGMAPASEEPPKKKKKSVKFGAGAGKQLTSVKHDTFTTADEFEDFLFTVEVDTCSWGTGGAKKVEDLLGELRDKESTLQRQMFRRATDRGVELIGGKCYRRLRVVKVVVRSVKDGNRHLACYEQQMADGRMRKRNVLLAEKIIASEDPKEAAIRGVIEEIGQHLPDPSLCELVPQSLLVWDELVDSPSYPSLITQYTLHQIEVIVPGLPQESFATMEGKKKHFWEWRDDGPDDLRRKNVA